MPCYRPLTAWRGKETTEAGKTPLVFNEKNAAQRDEPMQIACGQCIGCRLEKSRVWAMRCMHESSLHVNNCFITLTFNQEELQKRENPGSVDIRDFQLFMKKLRKQRNEKIRYFHCGEYGEKTNRPHYHAILFNCQFEDRIHLSTVNDNPLYTSATLDKIWNRGFASIGECTFESAAYVARYCMKKINGEMAEEHYNYVVEHTGEFKEKNPEYASMSRRPGIGSEWFEKYHEDIYPKDWISVRGKKCRPGKYYDRQLEITRPYEFEYIKEKREVLIRKTEPETLERLLIREKVKREQIKTLTRKLD